VTLVSDTVFHWYMTTITGGVAAVWVIHDVVLIARLRGADHRDALVADKRFGYAMGIIIGMIGVIGTLRFNGVL
jgi:hypothetical protein